QPFDMTAVVESFARGYRIAQTEPQGPVYLCYDVNLQEDEFQGKLELPDPGRTLHTRLQADPSDLEKAADMLTRAERPVIIADYLGRNQERVATLVELAELLAAPVIDRNGRFNFPNTHPLYSLGRSPLEEADLVLALDARDFYGCLMETDVENQPIRPLIPAGCRLIEISTGGLGVRGWSQHFQRFQQVDLSILADTYVALPALLEACRRAAPAAPLSSSTAQRGVRIQEWAKRHEAQRQRWREEARQNWEARPMTPSRMASEVWEAIRTKDWVLTANTVEDWALKLWDFDVPYRHPGKALGTATQIGISLGVALAYKGSGKLVVDLQPDGDLLFDAGALWVATHHQIPMLAVMYNNRAYWNDWDHQIRVARMRGRNEANAYLGMEIGRPEPDFAGLARSFGWYAEGPIENGDEVRAAVERAIRVIEKEGRPALVDVVTGFPEE
ncbi:MAG: thiamine pyrophosphate-dependent enzyme, partial [Firmicutes bacterium]|nr:thiamine pyrophosphate-dependent enzyme [Bacillota bacterium]